MGAIVSADCANYLPGNYLIQIAGYGNQEDIIILKGKIENINKHLNRAAVIYHGLLNENNLSSLFEKCQIALNPQQLGEYMDTAFPSKVLVYLNYGLTVVSTNIKSIETSQIAHLIKFVDKNDPELFAQEIQKNDLKSLNKFEHVLNELNYSFIRDIQLHFNY